MFAVTLAACVETPLPDAIGRAAPEGAPPDTCWGTIIEPARIETVTQQVMVRPPIKDTNGLILSPGVFASETRQNIISPRQETFFQAPCPQDMTKDYIASLQRALQVRNLYDGPISGIWNSDTREAVRAYQAPLGVDSGALSLEAARKLGISEVARDGT